MLVRNQVTTVQVRNLLDKSMTASIQCEACIGLRFSLTCIEKKKKKKKKIPLKVQIYKEATQQKKRLPKSKHKNNTEEKQWKSPSVLSITSLTSGLTPVGTMQQEIRDCFILYHNNKNNRWQIALRVDVN